MNIKILSQKYLSFERDTVLTDLEKEIFFDIGLPVIDTDYHTFFPVEKLQITLIENEQFIIIGSPLGFSFQDNVIVLCVKTKRVYFYSKMFYNIGRYKSMFLKVNKNIASFVFFQKSIFAFVQKLIEADIKDFDNIKNEFFLLKKTLINIDSFGFNLKIPDRDNISHWDIRIAELQQECEEKFNSFFEEE